MSPATLRLPDAAPLNNSKPPPTRRMVMSMSKRSQMNARERLVFHVQELERAERLKHEATECVNDAIRAAKQAGYDPTTLKVVLKLRKMTAEQRRERRALEAIYLAALGMLDGDALPEEARRRLDPDPEPKSPPDTPPQSERAPDAAAAQASKKKSSEKQKPQQALVLKTPEEARQEGEDASAAGKRIYDNPYPAGDPCRAAWDEGWCAQRKSHGMDTPAAYQRRSKSPEKDGKTDKDEKSGGSGEHQEADA